ncbi:MAG: glycosyltransferase family 2 protein [Pseudomonadota bacterium]
MDISIIIVNWNTIDLLKDCLSSVVQNLGDLEAEIIVIDNASSDGSQEMVERDFPSAVLIRNEKNVGFAAANNQGFLIAKSENILLLNSDTVVHGDVLQKSVSYLDEHPSVGAMGCRVLNTDGTVQLTCSEFPTLINLFVMSSGLWKLKTPRWFGKYLMTDWQRDSERSVEVISGCYLLVRNKVIREVGALDEHFFFFGEETDWCYRMRKAGWQLMFAPVGEITHHGGGSVKKLNHKRDILLTNSKVKLHRKHGGVVAAAVCWLILAFFNATRAVFWTLRNLFASSPAAKERAVHFRRVFLSLGDAWSGRI